MDDETAEVINSYKVEETELEGELDRFDIEQFLINEFDAIEESYQKLEFMYHGLKAGRKVKYGT